MFFALRKRSTIFRLSLGFMAVFAVSFLLLGLFIYFQATAYLKRDLLASVDPVAAAATEAFRRGGLDALERAMDGEFGGDADSQAVYLVVDSRCNPVSGQLDRKPSQEAIAPRCEELFRQGDWFDYELNELESASESALAFARIMPLSEDHGFLYGTDIGQLDVLEEILLTVLLWGFVLMLGLGVGGSLLMSRNIASRLRKLTRTSREIRRGNLASRMPVDDTNDEFDRLAVNLNEMMDQIEALMDAVKNTSNAIAHDLRTPLTRLLHSLEELRVLLPEETNLDGHVEQSIEEAGKVLDTFNALLRIAQIESGARRRDFEPMNLRHVITDIVEFYWPVAVEKGVTLRSRLNGSGEFVGDQDLISQAVSNLADNAIKYTPPGGTVTVGTEDSDGGPRIFVSDSGPGIPENEHENVFNRFYRLEAHRDSEGNGLGLSVVDAVAKLHGATVRLESNDPGLHIRVDLPS